MKRALALLLTALTGFSGLVYEVAWEKYLATLLGSHSEATAAVLGIFLGGLSLGYSLFGSITRRIVAAGRGGSLLVFYGVVEGGIGLYVLLFPTLFGMVLVASAALPQGVTGVGFALDVLLSAVLIGPPAVLMGGTIPILTQALSRDTAESTRFHAFVYAFNTAGAFFGALAAAFVLIPSYGLEGVMFAMGLVNLSAGTIFGLLGLRSFGGRTPVDAQEGDGARVDSFAIYAAAALLIGFAMMTLQTALIRIGGLSLGASQFTFSMVVAVFVLCIALGSFAVSALSRIPRWTLVASQWLLAALLIALYLVIPYAPYAAHVLRTLFRDTDAAFHPFYGAAFTCILLIIGPAVLLSGAALPLLFHQLRREVADLGSIAGRLYSWNTLGSLLGALVGGYALLFWLDLHAVYRVAVAAVAVAAALLATRLPARQRTVGLVALVPVVLALFFVSPWDHTYLALGTFRDREPTADSYRGAEAYFAPARRALSIPFYEDGPVASVAVIEANEGQTMSRSIVNNGKSDGNTVADYPTMALAALIPAVLAEKTERAFVIGYGTGITVGELAALPGMQQVVVAEISQGVINAAPLFDYANLEVTKNPKVEIIRSDAYRALMRSQREQFDVIVSEPSNPWMAGVEMLFSREFLKAARDRLAPGGVYAQWYHQYSSDEKSVELVMRTYTSVFSHVAVWHGLGADLLLLGFKDERVRIDVDRLERRFDQPEFAAGFARAGVHDLAQLYAHEILPLGVVHAIRSDGELHTLYHPRLGYIAARAFFRGQRAKTPSTASGRAAQIGAKESLLGAYIDRAAPSRRAIFDAVCQPTGRTNECVARLALWWREDPGSPELEEMIEEASHRPHMFGEPITPSLVRSLSLLFLPPDGELETTAIPLREAERVTGQFFQYYSHATPFSPRALLQLWKRCDDGGSGACLAGRTRLRALF